ncbi:uroplakin-3a [Piliocolobus tephrosceles]|uniref:uroplakin-3a n=1 Tax=Piliocolobus tephrosceles TaxID=591936 RepID=UPI001301508D|nr:uroplakin-3a [Piliocolobus tephrosceles]
MPLLWVLLALGCLRFGSAVNLQPQLASVTFATNNPTLTTVALEKPLCMFDSSEALTGTHKVYLYVLVDSAGSRNASVQDSAKTPLDSTFLQTEGGRTGPYKAMAFDLIPCSDLPSLDAIGDVSQASQILNAYLVRVGANRTCLWDPNFQGLCNPPLSAATEYRFKYVLVNMSTGLVEDQTLWSDPIRTNQHPEDITEPANQCQQLPATRHLAEKLNPYLLKSPCVCFSVTYSKHIFTESPGHKAPCVNWKTSDAPLTTREHGEGKKDTDRWWLN